MKSRTPKENILTIPEKVIIIHIPKRIIKLSQQQFWIALQGRHLTVASSCKCFEEHLIIMLRDVGQAAHVELDLFADLGAGVQIVVVIACSWAGRRLAKSWRRVVAVDALGG